MGRQTGRRAFLSTVLTGSVAALAGCGGEDGTGNGTEDGTEDGTDSPSDGSGNASSSGMDGSYPMFGGKPERNGYLSEESGPDEPTEQWSVEFEPSFYNSPIVADGAIYQTSRDSETLYAISAEDGSELWTYDLESTEIPAEPAVADGRVFVGGKVGKVHAIDAATGKREWVYDTGNSNFETLRGPAVADETLYVAKTNQGGANGKLVALDVSNGDIRWEHQEAIGIMSAPVVADGTVYFEDEGTLFAVNTDDGSEEWSKEILTYLESDTTLLQRPVYHDGTLYAGGLGPYDGNGAGAVFAIDASDGSRIWRTEVDTDTRQPAVDGDSVYISGAEGQVFSLAADDGTIEWEVDANTERFSPTLTDEALYVSGDDNTVVSLDPTDGSEQWRFDTNGHPGEPVAVVDGTIYASTYRGTVHRIE
ncbi:MULTISPECIES: PQQ-binding-like beta-propeller repeat protein [Haloarcula]|uniref:outer membrane protein assembly factor BamB family protein n=1 Tax=Haloarcula TaxID=2237 RepID=UPI0023E8E612|nr:PQQ-binding-like beta-propeller repeat protein [Halomicroarcula sp. SHR3]